MKKLYSELVAVLKDHYNPTPSEIVQRPHFNSCYRKSGESVSTFVTELCALAEFYNFGDSLDDMIRDRILYRIMNSKIQQNLLAEKPTTLKRAVEIAQGMETASKNAKELTQQEAATETVHQVKPPTRGKETGSSKKFHGSCFCCGRVGHRREQCRMKDAVCCGCGKTGHLVRVCRNKSAGERKQQQSSGKKSVHHVKESPEEESDDDFALYSMNSTSKPCPYLVNIEVDEKPLQMEIDTGASLMLMSEHTFRENWPTLNLSHTGIKLHSYSGDTVYVTVKYGSQVDTLPLLVVKGEGPSLLGRN